MTSSRVIQRTLSPAQAATRDKLLAAVVELATDGGYEAVGVREVAARAGVSAATAYQHTNSKDQLLVEVLFSLGEKTTARAKAADGASPADRLSAVFRRIMFGVAAKPLLHQALYRAYLNTIAGPGTAGDGPVIGPEHASWIRDTLLAGDLAGHTPDEIDQAATVLSCLFLGAMVKVTAGTDPKDVMAVLDGACRQMLSSRKTTVTPRPQPS